MVTQRAYKKAEMQARQQSDADADKNSSIATVARAQDSSRESRPPRNIRQMIVMEERSHQITFAYAGCARAPIVADSQKGWRSS